MLMSSSRPSAVANDDHVTETSTVTAASDSAYSVNFCLIAAAAAAATAAVDL